MDPITMMLLMQALGSGGGAGGGEPTPDLEPLLPSGGGEKGGGLTGFQKGQLGLEGAGLLAQILGGIFAGDGSGEKRERLNMERQGLNIQGRQQVGQDFQNLMGLLLQSSGRGGL